MSHAEEKARRSCRLLIVDGHLSYVNMTFITVANEWRIILLILSPHSTYCLQPLNYDDLTLMRSRLLVCLGVQVYSMAFFGWLWDKYVSLVYWDSKTILLQLISKDILGDDSWYEAYIAKLTKLSVKRKEKTLSLRFQCYIYSCLFTDLLVTYQRATHTIWGAFPSAWLISDSCRVH